MAYLVVRGRFELGYVGEKRVGSRPDGDSVWFRPGRPSRFADLTTERSVDFNDGGLVQLRFEGVDALELHYDGDHHQLAWAAVSARDFLLRRLGFTHVGYAPGATIPTYVRYAQPPTIPGFILTRRIDPYGRPIVFAFTGTPPQADGTWHWLEPSLVATSLNAQLMAAGAAYPAYYSSLPWDLREVLTACAERAWRNDRVVWTSDVSTAGFEVRAAADLTALAIWPKLYRRLHHFFAEGHSRLHHFEEWLRETEQDDELWILSRGQVGNLHNVIQREGNYLRLCHWPEDLVLVPK